MLGPNICAEPCGYRIRFSYIIARLECNACLMDMSCQGKSIAPRKRKTNVALVCHISVRLLIGFQAPSHLARKDVLLKLEIQ